MTDAAGIESVEMVTDDLVSDNVAWTSDGERVAYLTAHDLGDYNSAETYALHIVDEDVDLERARLSTGWFGPAPTKNTVALSMAPNDRYIAFTVPGGSTSPQCSHLSAVTSWLVELHGDDDADARRLATDVEAARGTWSRDGLLLAYAEEHVVCGDDGVRNSFGWFLRGWDMVAAKQIENFHRVGAYVSAPAWSPRGQRLAGTAFAPDEGPRISWVFVLDRPGEVARNITAPGGCNEDFGAWFPDGERILVRESCTGRDARHFVVDVASESVLEELDDLGPSVAISPAGDRIVHLVQQNGQSYVAVYELESGDDVMIGTGTAPAWRPR